MLESSSRVPFTNPQVHFSLESPNTLNARERNKSSLRERRPDRYLDISRVSRECKHHPRAGGRRHAPAFLSPLCSRVSSAESREDPSRSSSPSLRGRRTLTWVGRATVGGCVGRHRSIDLPHSVGKIQRSRFRRPSPSTPTFSSSSTSSSSSSLLPSSGEGKRGGGG